MNVYKVMTIIITDDDDGHAELIKEGLENSGVTNHIIRFSDGEELWNYFCGETVHGYSFDKSQSYLLLLDINMPRMNGIEVLLRMKQDVLFREIPVIMLTTTDDPGEVEKCYKIGCNIYITKPVDFTQFTETLRRLGLFLQVVKS